MGAELVRGTPIFVSEGFVSPPHTRVEFVLGRTLSVDLDRLRSGPLPSLRQLLSLAGSMVLIFMTIACVKLVGIESLVMVNSNVRGLGRKV